MQLGKLSLVVDYAPGEIDRSISTFYRELLLAWNKHEHVRVRSHPPEALSDILNEPLFQNKLIIVNNEPLYRADWITDKSQAISHPEQSVNC